MLRKALTVMFVLGGFCAVAQNKKEPAKAQSTAVAPSIDYHQVGAPMPHLMLVTLDTPGKSMTEKKIAKFNKNTKDYQLTEYGAKMYTYKHLDNGANIMVMMFNPTCGHCEDETEMLIRNKEMFKKTKLVLLANQNMMAYLPDFIRNHNIRDNSFITLGVDSTDFIKETFLYQALPQINIYSADRKLLRTYTGSVSIDSLAQYIQ